MTSSLRWRARPVWRGGCGVRVVDTFIFVVHFAVDFPESLLRRAFVFVAVRVAVDLPKTLFRRHTPFFVEPDLSFAFVLCWAAFFVRS